MRARLGEEFWTVVDRSEGDNSDGKVYDKSGGSIHRDPCSQIERHRPITHSRGDQTRRCLCKDRGLKRCESEVNPGGS